MRKIKALQSGFLNALQVPRDLAYQDSIVTCNGSSEILIENYRKIIEYQSTCIRILLKHGRLQIEGEHLLITYYCRDEMKITGFVQAVFFD